MKLMKESLQRDNSISYTKLIQIVDACQTASGNATGVGKIKGMLGFIKENGQIIIREFNDPPGSSIPVKNEIQLAEIFKGIDHSLDITSDKNFTEWF